MVQLRKISVLAIATILVSMGIHGCDAARPRSDDSLGRLSAAHSASASSNIAALDDASLSVTGAEADTVFVLDGESFSAPFVNASLIGQGVAASEQRYYLFRADDCRDCDAGTSLYIVLPKADGSWAVDRYPYPGSGYGWEHYRARAYYGACTTEPYDLVWEVLETGPGDWTLHPEESQEIDATPRHYVARVYTGNIGAKLIAWDPRLQAEIGESLQRGQCKEIPDLGEHLAEVGFYSRQ